MKKLILIAAFVFGAAFFSTVQAQNFSDNAIGLRVGGGGGYGAEISYQRALSGENRLELDLGWRNDSYYDAFKIVGLYQWVWNIDGGFNWYAGAGAGIGNVDVPGDYNDRYPEDGFFALVAGDIGVEYNFDFPLQLSLDFRPEIGLNSYEVIDDFTPDVALGIRYRF